MSTNGVVGANNRAPLPPNIDTDRTCKEHIPTNQMIHKT